MDIKGLVEQLIQAGAFSRVTNDPRAQFGAPARRYLGAEILPEKMVPVNDFTEEGIAYRTVIANAGTRYSPVQLKQGVISGSMKVSLGYSDIGSQITGADYDALLRLIDFANGVLTVNSGGVSNLPPMSAIQTSLFNWVDMALSRPLLEHNEKNRWDAIVSAVVTLTGDNGFSQSVSYPNPTGSRAAAGGDWASNSYDPYDDIMAGAEYLANKGYSVNRIITSRTVVAKLARNTKMTNRLSKVILTGTTIAAQPPGRATQQALSSLMAEDDLPMIETYNLQYRTAGSSGYFLPRTVFVMLATTGRDQTIDLGDLQPIPNMQNTLGYTAIGTGAGQNTPGRVIKSRAVDYNKPPRVEGEAWQASLPVLQDPEALFVITGI